jgi:ubiquitin-conjugating enzyme E2 O
MEGESGLFLHRAPAARAARVGWSQFYMADDNDPQTATTPDAAPADRRSTVERFLASLFADRLLSDRHASPSPSHAAPSAPATPQPASLAAATALAPPNAASVPRASPAAGTATPQAHMGSRPTDVVFCVEDTVGLKGDKLSVGVVDRCFGDVDSHSPRPQRDYGEAIERHEQLSTDDFDKFMWSGIPPQGTVLVSWQTKYKTELIPETCLELLDRALYVGDVVKRTFKDPMSGTVIGTKAVCTLFPATMFSPATLVQSLSEDHSIRVVPAEELINVHEYVEGALVVYGDWVGRIDQVFDEVAIKLSNNSVVVVEDPEDLEYEDFMLERLSVGDTVKTKKGNLRRGRWRYGAFDPNVRPQGLVVETRTTWIDVRWLTKRIGPDAPEDDDEPPARLFTDEMEDPSFRMYDAARSADSLLPFAANGSDRSYQVAEVAVGDRVRFKDIAGAAVKYDGSVTLPNGFPQGKVTRQMRTETLGYDMNVFHVMQTHTKVTVQWQDLTVTEDLSPSLIPDPNVEDDDEVWPGEIICTKEEAEGPGPDVPWTFRPAKVGIVQAVKSHDRIATVRWFENPTIQFLDDDIIPPSETGKLSEATEDVSLYDIRSTPSLTRRRGDFVLVHPDSFDNDIIPDNMKGPSWFGEVIDLGLDGKITVRLGAADPTLDIRVSSERVTLAYSSDMDNLGMEGSEDDDEEDSDEEESVSDFDSASFNEMWIEYEGMDGEPVEGNEEDWSTEDEEDSDGDVSMRDAVPSEEATASDTTPEVPSDSDKSHPLSQAQNTVHTPAVEEENAAANPPSEENPSAGLESFLILDTPPPTDHHYLTKSPASSSASMRRITKEHKILRNSLPPGIFVRTWESRLDLLRVLMIGPEDTPYEYAPFVIDLYLSSEYPQYAPEAFFHSWTNGNGPVNPNLYEDGKICLSLLGTWHADERNESWAPGKSTLLQVLVSIMGLVLVKDPYYNEAGYDVHRQAQETRPSSALYTERSYFRTRAFIVHALTKDVPPFAEELRYLYRDEDKGAPRLLDKAIEASRAVLERSGQDNDEERDGLRRISLGATVMLKRQVEKLEELKAQSKSP